MGIPVLLSRSGITHMGLELARDLRILMIARAKGRHFLVYHGAEDVIFDQPPAPGVGSKAREAVAGGLA
jgi:FdhD protein